MNDKQIEESIQAKGLTATRVTPADIEAAIESEHYFTGFDGIMKAQLRMRIAPHVPMGADMITICTLFMKNGTKVVGVNTGPVSPENFDEQLGRDLARANAINQIWPMLGYELRTKMKEQA